MGFRLGFVWVSVTRLAVPTGDVQVKAKLREFGEPVSASTAPSSSAPQSLSSEVCIFGEGPYERRDRLRTIMAGRRFLRAFALVSTLCRNTEIGI